MIAQLLAYLRDPATLVALTFLMVATLRKHWPASWFKIDGLLPVLLCSVVSGIVLALGGALLSQTFLVGWLPALETGAACGVLAFAGANGWQWAISKLPLPIQQIASALLEAMVTMLKQRADAETDALKVIADARAAKQAVATVPDGIRQ